MLRSMSCIESHQITYYASPWRGNQWGQGSFHSEQSLSCRGPFKVKVIWRKKKACMHFKKSFRYWVQTNQFNVNLLQNCNLCKLSMGLFDFEGKHAQIWVTLSGLVSIVLHTVASHIWLNNQMLFSEALSAWDSLWHARVENREKQRNSLSRI